MIEAELPDGTVLEFPDGTNPSVIQSIVKQRLNPTIQTPTIAPQLTPAEEFANESPIARTIGRTARTGLAGISSLADIGLLVPKTGALLAGMGAEALGAENLGQGLQAWGATPSMRDTTLSIIDQATGGVLQPTGAIDRAGDFAGELIASAVPFSRGQQVTSALAPSVIDNPTSIGGSLAALANPGEVIANQLPSAASRSILPVPNVMDEGRRVVDLAKQYDIPIGLDDVSDSPFYNTLISEGRTIPFSGAAKQSENQLKKFTQAVSKSVGLDTDKLTVESINDAFTNVGKEFDNLTKGKTFTMNDDVAQGLNDILTVAESGGYGADGVKLYSQYVKDLGAVVGQDGVVDGNTLAKLRAKLNAVGRKASDQNAKALANELESTISDFITDGSPEALRQAKYRYKNLLAIEPLASKDQLGGQISPSQLLGRVRSVYKRQFSRGQAGELGDLANIGQYIKETIPNSGTAQRTGARALLTGNLGVAPFVGMANPVAGALQAGTSLAGIAGNRALQSRNFDDELLQIAVGNLAQRPLLSQESALAALGAANSAGQQSLAAPQLRITQQPLSALQQYR